LKDPMTLLHRLMNLKNLGEKANHWPSALFVAAGVSLLLGVGCISQSKSETGGFLTVVVHARTHDQVRDTTALVFREHGYRVVQNGWGKLVFEKEGTTMEKIAYASLMDGVAWIRVKVSLYDVSADTFRLESQAFAVRGKGEALEEEVKLTKMSRGRFKDMMSEIEKRLGGKPATSS
jgi:hypothetical protein